MNLIVNNLITNYNLSGKGKLVLLLHGWGDSSKGLATLHSKLADQYQVLSIDLPGFGGTQIPPKAWGLDDYADFVVDTLQKLSLGQPYAVLGHSNGAAIAIRGTASGRLAPQKLVLVGAAGIRNNKSSRRALLTIFAKVANVATIWLPPSRRQQLRAHMYGAIGSDLLAVPAMQETFKKTVRQDVQSDAASLGLPTLLIYGANDTATPVADGKRYQGLISSSRLEIVENAGHFVHLDQPEQVQQLIESFLAIGAKQ